MEELTKLQESAKRVSERAYAEFSKFKLGAALLTSTGKIFTGVNVENSSYGLTMCAERSAFFAAIQRARENLWLWQSIVKQI